MFCATIHTAVLALTSTALLVGNVMNERGDYEGAAAMLQGAVDRFVLTLRDDHKVTHHHDHRTTHTPSSVS
jgi:hypothetical protein